MRADALAASERVTCPGCGAHLADRLGGVVVVRVRVSASRCYRVVAPVRIECACGRTWRTEP